MSKVNSSSKYILIDLTKMILYCQIKHKIEMPYQVKTFQQNVVVFPFYSNSSYFLRLLECNGFTYLKPSRGFKNLLLFKYMPFEDDPPHRFSQFLLFWLYKQD